MIFDDQETVACPAEVEALTASERCGAGNDVGPGVDPNCDDPAYAAAHPDLCPPTSTQELRLKPEVAVTEVGMEIQYRTFLYQDGVETEIDPDHTGDMGLLYSVLNQDIALISPLYGSCTPWARITPAITRISVTWQGMSATAQLEVVAACSEIHNEFAIVIDNSESMGLAATAMTGTKLDWAKIIARRMVQTGNELKDRFSVLKFSEGGFLSQPLTSDLDLAEMAVAEVEQTDATTNIYDGLHDAIEFLNENATGRKIIIMLTDLENKEGVSPLNIARAFRTSGGILIVIGIRSHGDGFDLGQRISTHGFFINATGENEEDVETMARGLKTYLCSAVCTPEDVIVNYAQLNYTGFINWDVSSGVVDLIGGEEIPLFDFLPGNGLYVDLVGSSAPWLGTISSKTTFEFADGGRYRVTVRVAGNQRIDTAGFITLLAIPGLLNQEIEPASYIQKFTTYTYEILVSGGVSAKLSISQSARPSNSGVSDSFGNLLDYVKLERTDAGNEAILLENDFDDENPTYFPPHCPPAILGGPLMVGSGYNCYDDNVCLDEPIPQQEEDANPPADIED